MCLKKVVGILRAISGSDHPKNFTTAIIAAGGYSARFVNLKRELQEEIMNRMRHCR